MCGGVDLLVVFENVKEVFSGDIFKWCSVLVIMIDSKVIGDKVKM